MASIAKRVDGRWRARYRDSRGREHARHFTRRIDAQRWLDSVTTAVQTGTYVDPALGKITVAEWSERWLAGQAHLEPSTVRADASVVRKHVLPGVGRNFALADVSHADVQAWVSRLTRRILGIDGPQGAPGALVDPFRSPSATAASSRTRPTVSDCRASRRDDRRYLTHEQVRELAAVVVLTRPRLWRSAARSAGTPRPTTTLSCCSSPTPECGSARWQRFACAGSIRSRRSCGVPAGGRDVGLTGRSSGEHRRDTPGDGVSVAALRRRAGSASTLPAAGRTISCSPRRRGEPLRAGNFRRDVFTPATRRGRP